MFALNGRRVVACWAEYAEGPGWDNQLVHVLLQDKNLAYSVERLQPEEVRSKTIRALMETSDAINRAMVRQVSRLLDEGGVGAD